MPNPKLETYKNKATGVVYDYTDADAQSKIPSTASPSNKMATASDVTTLTNGVIANTKLIADTVGWSGKNKILYPYVDSSGSYGGATITDMGDGTVKANGTNTGAVTVKLSNDLKLSVGDYIATKGSNSPDYGLVVEAYNDNTWVKILASSYSNDKVAFSVDYDGYTRVVASIKAEANKTVSDLILKPMICDKDILDLSFEKGRATTAVDWESYAKTGVHNLNFTDYTKAQVTPDLTVTDNGDGSFSVSGTTVNNNVLAGGNAANFVNQYVGNIKLVGGQENITVALYDATAGSTVCSDTGSGATGTMVAGHSYRVTVTFAGSKTFSDVTVVPMILSANDTYTGATKPAMTNEQLTELVGKSVVISISNQDITDLVYSCLQVGKTLVINATYTKKGSSWSTFYIHGYKLAGNFDNSNVLNIGQGAGAKITAYNDSGDGIQISEPTSTDQTNKSHICAVLNIK